ncbi:Major facilitator superfamily transporter [Pleurostoma richardsiae]|uniref:Major facilitator superfamily transporter n=1 Tax=Pleurostoma richardsiae TaxID=41990 RepID=A0AA38VH27_9PEZI|nr:Major facilitator superfamily transporter [Pleurostoma richardsiae]
MSLDDKTQRRDEATRSTASLARDNEVERQLTRRLLWKLDVRVLPSLALLVLCSLLDRASVGNARLYNLESDLHMTDHQYNQGLAVFYATYIASDIPSNLVIKRIRPRIWLPFLAFSWGIISMSFGFIQNFAGFVTVRAFLGLAEGGLLPGMILYMSGIYTREELVLRIGVFNTAASLSGAFGGLLARGIIQMGHMGGLSPWRWIFVIEGLFTIVAALTAFLILPGRLSSARFLTSEEKELAIRRHLDQGSGSSNNEDEEKFSWGEVARGIFNIQTWLTASADFAILTGMYSFSIFLPTIIAGFGYTANEAQLWSVIPYAVAAVVTLFVAFLSDRLRLRGVIMLFTLVLAIIGYAGIANTRDVHVKYGMTFLMASGVYSSIPPVLGWLANNSAGHYKRATCSAAQVAIANCGGFVAMFAYPVRQGPRYKEGHTIVLGLLCAAWVLTLLNVLYCVKVNRDKARGKFEWYRGCGDDRYPSFKLVL